MEIINYNALLNEVKYVSSVLSGDVIMIARPAPGSKEYTTLLGDPTVLFPAYVPTINLNINKQTASYTLNLSDGTTNPGTLVEINSAAANNLTIPPNSSVNFPIGVPILVASYGAGQTTIVAGAGVTIRSSGSKVKLTQQYSMGTLIQRAVNEWYFSGDIA